MPYIGQFGLPEKPIGLALAGGGVRGYAQIGVLEMLEKHGYGVDMVAGTSIGSFVATLVAMGLSAKEIYEKFQGFENNFTENNTGKYKDQEQQLYSFFQRSERFVFHYAEIYKIIKYFINDENDKIELHLPSKDITIQNPSHTSTKTITQKLTITSETISYTDYKNTKMKKR